MTEVIKCSAIACIFARTDAISFCQSRGTSGRTDVNPKRLMARNTSPCWTLTEKRVLLWGPLMHASGVLRAKCALTGMVKCLAQEYKWQGVRFTLMHLGGVDSTFWDNVTMKVDRSNMLSVDAAAQAAFFAATQPGEGVMAEVVLMPESHQLV